MYYNLEIASESAALGSVNVLGLPSSGDRISTIAGWATVECAIWSVDTTIIDGAEVTVLKPSLYVTVDE